MEKLKEAIELRYLSTDVQIKSCGKIIGNSCFTDDEISELNRYKPDREKIYKELKKLDEKTCFKVLETILAGFVYIEDDRGSIEPLAKLYREAKKRIEKKVQTENKKLTGENPYFKTFPIIIYFKHHLDSPAKTGAPGLNRNTLVRDISEHLSTCISSQAGRAKLIERILRYFYAVPKTEAKARNIRSYC